MSEIEPKAVTRKIIWFGPVLLVWVAVILPSCFHAVWSSFDDGVTLIMAQGGVRACFNMNAGRMIPVYWLHNWLLYQIGGVNPTVWYAVQSLEFLLAALFIYLAVGCISDNWPAGMLAAAVMLTSAPIAENAYTISKCEPRMALFITLAMLLVSLRFKSAIARNSIHCRSLARRLCWVGFFLAVAFSVFTKESGVAVAAVGIAGMLASLVQMRNSRRQKAIRFFVVITFITVPVALSLVFLRAKALKNADTAYTAFTFDPHMCLSNLAAYLRQSPDIIIVAFACLLFGAVQLWGRRREDGVQNERFETAAVMAWTTLATGLAYLLILLVWRGHTNYYMLPVAVCVNLSLGFFIATGRPMREGWRSRSLRWPVGVLLISIAATRLFSIPYLHFIAAAQRSFDVIEDAVAQEARKANPTQQRIIDIERPYFVEQPIQRNLLYRALGAPHVSWVGGGELVRQYSEDFKKIFGVTDPSPLKNSPANVDDLLVVQAGSCPFDIELRGIAPGVTSFALADQEVKQFEARTGLSISQLHTFDSVRVVFEPWTLRKANLEFRSVVYECNLGKPHRLDWEGRFGDGWIGREATLHIVEDMRARPGLLRVRTIPYGWAVPIRVTLAGEKVQTIELNSKNLEETVSIDKLLPSRQGTIRITASKMWVLQEFQPESKEKRALSVRVDYEPGGPVRQEQKE